MNFARKELLVAVSTLALCVACAHATDRLVPIQYVTIQAAIDAAAPGDSVIIADGTYTGAGNKDLDFGGKAITVRSASGDPTLCVIDCQGAGRGFYFHSGEPTTAVVDGITVANGKAPTEGSGQNTQARGGGIICLNGASPTIRDCEIEGCKAVLSNSSYGGGVYCGSGASPLFERCKIRPNNVDGNSYARGGSIACQNAGVVTFRQCQIKGAAYSLDEQADGGGIYCESTTALIVDSCVIEQCTAQTGGPDGYSPFGGGIYAASTPAVIVNSLIQDNVASSGGDTSGASGGGMRLNSLSMIVNCVVRNNLADGRLFETGWATGGGIYVGPNSRIINSTVTGNQALASSHLGPPDKASASGGGIQGGIVINSIVSGNSVNAAGGPTSGPQVAGSTVRYSNIAGGATGVGNIDANSQFLPSSYRVAATSPVIDAGSNGALPADDYDLDNDGDFGEPLPIDIDGVVRFVDGPVTDTGVGTPPIVDMGAAEYFDCDSNGIDDAGEVAAGTAADCDQNGVPDVCQTDTDFDGIPDACDCNGNGILDGDDISAGSASDCNANLILDECDLSVGTSSDCDANSVPDECDPDCDSNLVPDACDIAAGTNTDADLNGIPDLCDLDCNTNGITDAFDLSHGTSADCNSNGVPDECDIAGATSEDCNMNAAPDECDLTMASLFDCNLNGVVDTCEVGSSAIALDGNGDYVDAGSTLPVVSAFTIEAWIRLDDPNPKQMIFSRRATNPNRGFSLYIEQREIKFQVTGGTIFDTGPRINAGQWYHIAVPYTSPPPPASPSLRVYINGQQQLSSSGGTVPTFDQTTVFLGAETPAGAAGLNGLIDEVLFWDFYRGPAQIQDDYVTKATGNEDGLLAYWSLDDGSGSIVLDIAGGHDGILQGNATWHTADADGNGTPDECMDCNSNGLQDFVDIAGATSADCNLNLLPDDCDIAAAISADCDLNGIPDECEQIPDCNANGTHDDCDIASGTSTDCDSNGVPDECDPDCNANGINDECDIVSGASADCDSNGVPDECDPDCNTNGFNDACETAAGTSADCDSNGVPDACELTNRSGVVFDGDGDYVDVGSNVPAPETLTIEAWIRTSDVNLKQIIWGRRSLDPVKGVAFFIENESLTFTTLGILRYDSTAELISNRWHHVAVSFDGENPEGNMVRFYLDGLPAGEVTGSGGINNALVGTFVGALPPTADFAFLGAIDEVHVWDTVRNESEIAIDYMTQPTGTELGLIGYWNMDEGSGSTTADIAGGNNGTLEGDASWVAADSDVNGVIDVCQTVVPDCNLNDITDAADISGGTSADCNTNGIPDECDTGTLADYDVDGDVDYHDYAGFEACLFGPVMDMQLMSPCGASCLQWFDANGDNRIDLYDFGYLQEHMSSP